MKAVTSFEELIKGVSETIKKEGKEEKRCYYVCY